MSDDYTKFLKPAGNTVGGAITAIYPASAGGVGQLGNGLSGLLGAAGISIDDAPKETSEPKKFDAFGFKPVGKEERTLPPPLPPNEPPDAETLQLAAHVVDAAPEPPPPRSERDMVADLLARRGWSFADIEKILAGPPQEIEPPLQLHPATRVQPQPAQRVKTERGTAEMGATASSAVRLASRIFGAG